MLILGLLQDLMKKHLPDFKFMLNIFGYLYPNASKNNN